MSGRADPDAIEVIRPYQNNSHGDNPNNGSNGDGNGTGYGNGTPGVNTSQGEGVRENEDAQAKAAGEAAAEAAETSAAAAAATTSGRAQPTHRHYYISALDVGHYPGDQGVPSGSHSPANKDAFPLCDTHPLSGIGGGEDGDAYGTPIIDDRTKLQRWYEYVSYYVPIIQWLPKYKLGYIHKDLFAGLTLASISIPMSLSYAANLAKIRPVNGLYATIAAPIVYAFLGPTSRLAVLPEAALSLVVGEAIRQNTKEHESAHPHIDHASDMACLITLLAAVITLVAGILRLGFVDAIGSPPLLRGFISGVAIVIFVEQLIPELGLEALASETGAAHQSAWQKAIFVYEHVGETHLLTFYIALTAFFTLVVAKAAKQYVQKKWNKNWVSLIPDILAVVAASAWFTWYYEWDKAGVMILGEVETGKFAVKWPISWSMITDPKFNFRSVLSSAMVVAILGFFESMVGVKHLAIVENQVSKANRELVALGAVNGVVCTSPLPAIVPGLPVYGGLARSKINEYSGAKTQFSGVALSFFTFLATKYLLKPFAWLPKASLSAVISTVCLSLLGEAPEDLMYYWSLRAWREMGMILVVIFTTVFWSIDVGIYAGLGVSLLLLVHAAGEHSIMPLKRTTTNDFVVNDQAKFYPFAMMVKFTTDKLTFANTAHLKEGLNRLEKHGRLEGSHPGDAPTRFPEQNVNLVFDFSNVTYVDSSATQILRQIFQAHLQDGSLIYFAGLNPVVKGIFTKARVWALFGEGEWCGKDVPEAMTLADAREGNLEEARRRARRGGRGANFEAEEDRLQYYTGQRRLDPVVP